MMINCVHGAIQVPSIVIVIQIHFLLKVNISVLLLKQLICMEMFEGNKIRKY